MSLSPSSSVNPPKKSFGWASSRLRRQPPLGQQPDRSLRLSHPQVRPDGHQRIRPHNATQDQRAPGAILAIGGMSAMEWRNRYLLLEAQELMERTDMSITAIAAKLGFAALGILKFFRTLTKSQPWEWRIEKNRAQTGREPIIATSNQQAIHAQTHAKCAISAKFFVIKNV